ncbi:6-hydroxymethylpterin diphosphokinase MptE-like protein [uncultured Idiomarina sp.]|uniref:motility associated factor glycosyltransferase family protein n=1 Tax=uncultured Idiomarina sp. TaxID=352961 RepID=UPI0025960BF1|nr:6-hydroxymethylpterin diphosphokinase MptE-like protein [uncultured Idiomarina sp.]
MDNIQEQISNLMHKLQASEDQVEREKLFAREAEERFHVNLEAFRSFYPNVAKSIEEYKSEKPLELFVTKSGHGNIREHKTGVPLYGDDPISQVSTQVDKHLTNPFINHIDFSIYADVPDDDERLHARHLKQLGLVVKNSGKYEKLKVMPRRFPTAVVFGVGLGYHLPVLFEQVQFDYIYLIEPSFENFYCSLFCIDWKSLIEKVDEQYGALIFQLGASYQTFIDDLYRVSQDLGAFTLTKCFCYQHYPSKDNAELIMQFYKRLFEMHSGYGFYNDATTAIAHTVENTNRGINLIKYEASGRNPFRRYPVYVIGNGPSLDDSINFIKETQHEALIIAAGTALQTLLKHGVNPDFHALIERPKSTYDVLTMSLPKEEYKKLNLLTMSLIYPDVVPLYNWVGMAGKGIDAGGELLHFTRLNEEGKPLPFLPFCNPLVSNTALTYALHMGFKDIYLFGVDNGYSSDGRHHAKDSDYYKGGLKDWKPHDANHELEGNLGGTVMASNFLAMSCQQMGRLLGMPHFKSVTCYNVGDGAKIDNTIPLKPELLLPDFINEPKKNVISFIKSELFEGFKANEFETYMEFEKYDEICDHLISISSEEMDSRDKALDNLRRQSRYLYSHRGTKYSHLHYVLEGELLYFQCPMLVLLFNSNNEDECLMNFSKAMEKWRDFLYDAKSDLKTAWTEKCVTSFSVK